MRTPIQFLAVCLLPACLTGCGVATRPWLATAVRPEPIEHRDVAASVAQLPAGQSATPRTPSPVQLFRASTRDSSDSGNSSFRAGLDALFPTRDATPNTGIRMTAFDVESDASGSEESPPANGTPSADPFAGLPAASITLAELENMAATHNPTIQTAAAIARKAMGVRRQVGRCPNPIVGYTGQEMGAEGTAGQQGAFLNQQFVLGDKLEWNERVANGDVQTLLWQAETQRYRVRNDVRRQFFATLGAQEQVKLARELEQIADDGVRNAKILVDALQAARPDLYQAEIQLNEILILRRNAEYQHQAAWQQLANLVGVPTLPIAEIDHPLDEDLPFRDIEAVEQQLYAASPELQQARAEVQRDRMRIERERVQVIPNLQLQASTAYATGPHDPVTNIQLGVPLPLLNRNEGNIDRARAEYQRAAWNVQRLELRLASDLAGAYSEYQQAHNRVQTFRDEILPREQQTLDLIQQGYPVQFDFLRVLTARRSYFEARIDYLAALVDLRQTEVLLDGLLLTGGLDAVPDPDVDDGLRGHALSGQ